MPVDAHGNEVQLGSIVSLTYVVVKIDPHDPPDMDADVHLKAAHIADLAEIEVHASSVVCESGPPIGWTPPAEAAPPEGGAGRKPGTPGPGPGHPTHKAH